jgi:hypothetical protein
VNKATKHGGYEDPKAYNGAIDSFEFMDIPNIHVVPPLGRATPSAHRRIRASVHGRRTAAGRVWPRVLGA